MAVIKVKDYKTIDGVKVKKTKDVIDKETCKGKKWWYFFIRYVDVSGKVKPYRSKMFATKNEAEDAERKFHNKIGIVSSSKIAVDELFNEYEIYVSSQTNKDTSNYSDFINYNNHIKPYVGNIIISNITLETIRMLHYEINNKTYIRNKQKHFYKHEFKTKMHSLLSCMLDYAVSMGYLKENIAKRYGNFKKPNDEVIIDEEEVKYQTPKQFDRFISVVDDLIWKSFFMFLYWTGCRKGETQALTWEDIDFDTNMIRINKTLANKIKGGGWKITNTKNRKNRNIVILPQLRPILEELYMEQSKTFGFDKKWFVFGGIRFLANTTIDDKKKEYYDLVKNKYDINTIILTIHQFGRHSHASLLISLGVRVESIAKRLGDTEEVIRKTYAHLFPVYNDEIIEATSVKNIDAINEKMERYLVKHLKNAM